MTPIWTIIILILQAGITIFWGLYLYQRRENDKNLNNKFLKIDEKLLIIDKEHNELVIRVQKIELNLLNLLSTLDKNIAIMGERQKNIEREVSDIKKSLRFVKKRETDG